MYVRLDLVSIRAADRCPAYSLNRFHTSGQPSKGGDRRDLCGQRFDRGSRACLVLVALGVHRRYRFLSADGHLAVWSIARRIRCARNFTYLMVDLLSGRAISDSRRTRPRMNRAGLIDAGDRQRVRRCRRRMVGTPDKAQVDGGGNGGARNASAVRPLVPGFASRSSSSPRKNASEPATKATSAPSTSSVPEPSTM